MSWCAVPPPRSPCLGVGFFLDEGFSWGVGLANKNSAASRALGGIHVKVKSVTKA